MNQTLAPIALFAFNRVEALQNTITSLLSNREAADSILYIFVDGSRDDKLDEDKKVAAVQQYVTTITGFKEVIYSFSENNRGLGSSIIEGVTKVIDQHGKAIILEDDLLFSSNFLSFMNTGLVKYQNESKVFSICGYTNKVKAPKKYEYDAYFCTRSSSWGWATWADRWDSVDWKLDNWNEVEKQRNTFNRWGGSDCFSMLKGWKTGHNSSWAIRFCYAQYIQNRLSLFPIISKVKNDGFDGDGTNCKKYNRFVYEFDLGVKREFNYPESIQIIKTLFRSAISYHSYAKRAWSRLMYMIYS